MSRRKSKGAIDVILVRGSLVLISVVALLLLYFVAGTAFGEEVGLATGLGVALGMSSLLLVSGLTKDVRYDIGAVLYAILCWSGFLIDVFFV